MPNLCVNIAGIKMKNPFTVGSGTFGNDGEFEKFFPIELLGALTPKTIRSYEWPGNPPPRLAEAAAGLLSSVGIPSKSWERFVKEDVPVLKKIPIPVIQSVIGRTEEEYVEIVKKCSDLGVFAGIELNLSCPNLKQGGLSFGSDPKASESLIKKVRKQTKLPLIAKLPPDYSNIVNVAKAVESAGADAIAMINAPRAMAIDYKTRKPVLGNKVGALSGPAIKPIAVYLVWEVYKAVSIPIIGMGGIVDFRDVIEFMSAGARAVAFGTINFIDTQAIPRALKDLENYLIENNIDDVNEIVGCAHC